MRSSWLELLSSARRLVDVISFNYSHLIICHRCNYVAY